MGFSSEEFIRMREMETYTFDYFVPLKSERHYAFNIEAEDKEEAIMRAKNYIEDCNGCLDSSDFVGDWDYPEEVETGSTLVLDNKIVKSY